MPRLDAQGYQTDKSAQYLLNYGRFFGLLREQPVTLFEIGVDKGGSLLMWRDYFLHGVIVGLDRAPVFIQDATGRIRVYQGEQQDCSLLDRIAREMAPSGFDIIIDDASHLAEWTRISFWHLFQHHLKHGGMYIIEDWGTGYWDTWPDGRSFDGPISMPATGRESAERPPSKVSYPNHSHGMVGFIKQLVDECGMGDITKPRLGVGPHRESMFDRVQISHGQVFVVKA